MYSQAVELDGGDPKRKRVALSHLIALKVSPDSNTGEVQFAHVGEWLGHPAGPFKITANDIDSMVNAFNAQANPTVIDYEHQSLRDGAPGNGRAAGWIKSLERRDGAEGPELWGTVEWTQPAADMIRAGEYKFISPVIDFAAIDRKSGDPIGCEMMNAALTNNPFFDGQAPVVLSRVAFAAPPPKPDAQPAADPDAASESAAEDKGENEPAETQSSDPYDIARTAFDESMMAACNLDRGSMINAMFAYQSDIAAVINRNLQRDKPAQRGAFTRPAKETTMSEYKTEDKGAPAAGDAGNQDDDARMLRVQLEAQKAQLEQLQAESDARAKREAEAEAKRVRDHVDQLIAAGRMKQEQREDAVWLFSKDWAKGESIFGKAPALIAGSRAGVDPAIENKPAVDLEKATEADLTEGERMQVREMTKGGHYNQKDCIRFVLSNRDRLAKARTGAGLPH